MNEWYYVLSDAQQGPVSDDELLHLLKTGKINLQTLAWKEGQAGWQPIAGLAAFGDTIRKLPPPIPTSPQFPPEPKPAAAPARSEPTYRWQERNEPIVSRSQTTSAEIEQKLPEYPLAGPWRRFFARTIDQILFCGAIGFALFYYAQTKDPVLAQRLAAPDIQRVLPLVYLPISVLLQGVLMEFIGTTPGKALLGVRVSRTTTKPPFFFFFWVDREIEVYIFGLGLGLPLIGWIPSILQFLRVRAGRPASYDQGRVTVSYVR